ncbi:MAG: M3 family metallopeptidase, partial [Betaproteobacteria bacterium]|nr:M3 family metallopeptidase [Betaproteobacteria bacterium]
MRNDNPLLDFTGLPRFAELRPAHVTPALGQLLAEARAAVASAERAGPVWEEFVTPLEDANERVGRAWGQIAHLHAVLDSPELRAAYNENLPKITQYWTELGQNQALFEKYRALRAAADFAALSSARQRIVENALRDFRLGGAELPADKKPRYAQIQDELARLAAKFSENLLDATNAWTLVIEDEKRLAGIPADVLQAARLQDGRGWKFTLHMPSYLPVMQYAEDRSLREEMYRASSTRASEFGNPAIDNTPLIARILPLRHEAARLLGYANYADVSLVPKMADSPSQV